jgi:hypothetical protein
MKLSKTVKKMTCRKHGDTTTVHVVIPGAVRGVCKVCVDEAIKSYSEPVQCLDCNEPVKDGCGIEKDGLLLPYCKTHQTARLMNEKT